MATIQNEHPPELKAFEVEEEPKAGRVPGFINKTYEIFSDPNYSDLCGWSSSGGTIMIHKISEFSSTVLPKYFKHSNYASFVRQLNMYDFHKTVANPQIAEFYHPSFLKNRRDLLPSIKRKSRGDPKQEKETIIGGIRGTMQSSNSAQSRKSSKGEKHGASKRSELKPGYKQTQPNKLRQRAAAVVSAAPPPLESPMNAQHNSRKAVTVPRHPSEATTTTIGGLGDVSGMNVTDGVDRKNIAEHMCSSGDVAGMSEFDVEAEAHQDQFDWFLAPGDMQYHLEQNSNRDSNPNDFPARVTSQNGRYPHNSNPMLRGRTMEGGQAHFASRQEQGQMVGEKRKADSSHERKPSPSSRAGVHHALAHGSGMSRDVDANACSSKHHVSNASMQSNDLSAEVVLDTPQSAQGMVSMVAVNPAANSSYSVSPCATSTSLHVSLSDMGNKDFKVAVEAIIRSCQAEMVSLRNENAQLRSSLAETDRRMDALLGFTYSTIKANSGPNGAINVPGLETQGEGPNASVESINAPALPEEFEPPTVAEPGEMVNAFSEGEALPSSARVPAAVVDQRCLSGPVTETVTEPATGVDSAGVTCTTTGAATSVAANSTTMMPNSLTVTAEAMQAMAAAVAAPSTNPNPSSLLTDLQVQHDQQQLNQLEANARQLQPHIPSMLYANSSQMAAVPTTASELSQSGTQLSPAWSPAPDWSPLLKSPSHDTAPADKELMESLLADGDL